MELQQERPPYVRFETRAVEDRNASQENGMMQYKDMDFALVTPAGSKDVHEERADRWLKKQEHNAKEGRIPETHYRHFKALYESYQEGREEPETGIPIRSWPLISPAQVEQVLQANVRTVEDLAAAPEQALQRIGMGARALKQKAEAFLKSSEPGKAANEIQELQRKLDAAQREKERQAEKIDQLVKRVEAMESGVEVPIGEEVDIPETATPPRNKDGSIRKKPGRKPK